MLMIEKTTIQNKEYYNFSYYSEYNGHIFIIDECISAILKLNIIYYRNILKENGGKYFSESAVTYFKNEEDIRRAKDAIEAVLFMKKFVNNK